MVPTRREERKTVLKRLMATAGQTTLAAATSAADTKQNAPLPHLSNMKQNSVCISRRTQEEACILPCNKCLVPFLHAEKSFALSSAQPATRSHPDSHHAPDPPFKSLPLAGREGATLRFERGHVDLA